MIADSIKELTVTFENKLITIFTRDTVDEPHELLYTGDGNCLSDIVNNASKAANTPIALITMFVDNKQWLRSKIGVLIDETDKKVSFCNNTVLCMPFNNFFIVPDAILDPRFKNNPLVTGYPYIRFYAGIPIEIDGFVIGSLCVIDTKPRILNKDQYNALISLRDKLASYMQLKYNGKKPRLKERILKWLRL